MTEDKNNASFDAQVKMMLENAAEPVPAGVWSGVSGALARRERRMGMLLLLRRTSLAVAAAAAAVTAGIFLYGGLSENELTVADSQPMAAVTPLTDSAAPLEVKTVETLETVETESSTPVKLIKPEKAAPAKVAMATKKEAVKEDVTEVEPAEAEMAEEAEKAEVTEIVEATDIAEAKADVEATAQPDIYCFDINHPEADLLADAGAKPRSARRLSLNAGGVMESNLSPVHTSFNGRRRVSQAVPAKVGIKESVSQSEYSLPLSFGAGITWHFSERWGLGTGLTYTYLGRHFKGTYVSEVNDGLVVNAINGDIHNGLHYLGIPLTLSYTILDNRNIQLYGFADGMVEKAVSNRYRIEGMDGDVFYHESVDGVQYSFGGGVGIRFRLTDHLGLYLDPSLRYYPNCDQPRSIRTQEPLMFSIEAGLRFDL